MKLLLCGGGTMGPVSPLLAVADELRHQRPNQDEFLWIGTEGGPEKNIVEDYQIPFLSISSGKLRRYWSAENFLDFFRFLRGTRQSRRILRVFRPQLVLTAGGYVCVPVARAATRLHIPYFVHQQDVLPGLANRIMAKNAALITLTFAEGAKHFSKGKTAFTGNPVRAEILRGDKAIARSIFELKEEIPVILCMGGGSGAAWINEMVIGSLPELTASYQVLHLTGENKHISEERLPALAPFQRSRYRCFPFLSSEMKHAYAVADLVICRAGASTAAEGAVLGKPMLMIPIPDSHQMANALWFKKNNACFLFEQKKAGTPGEFAAMVKRIFSHSGEIATVQHNVKSMNPPDAAKRIVNEILKRTTT